MTNEQFKNICETEKIKTVKVDYWGEFEMEFENGVIVYAKCGCESDYDGCIDKINYDTNIEREERQRIRELEKEERLRKIAEQKAKDEEALEAGKKFFQEIKDKYPEEDWDSIFTYFRAK